MSGRRREAREESSNNRNINIEKKYRARPGKLLTEAVDFQTINVDAIGEERSDGSELCLVVEIKCRSGDRGSDAMVVLENDRISGAP